MNYGKPDVPNHDQSPNTAESKPAAKILVWLISVFIQTCPRFQLKQTQYCLIFHCSVEDETREDGCDVPEFLRGKKSVNILESLLVFMDHFHCTTLLKRFCMDSKYLF
jgi:hypothetical protein